MRGSHHPKAFLLKNTLQDVCGTPADHSRHSKVRWDIGFMLKSMNVYAEISVFPLRCFVFTATEQTKRRNKPNQTIQLHLAPPAKLCQTSPLHASSKIDWSTPSSYATADNTSPTVWSQPNLGVSQRNNEICLWTINLDVFETIQLGSNILVSIKIRFLKKNLAPNKMHCYCWKRTTICISHMGLI